MVTIDGTQVSEITIDGTIVREITMDGDVVYTTANTNTYIYNNGTYGGDWTFDSANNTTSSKNSDHLFIDMSTTTLDANRTAYWYWDAGSNWDVSLNNISIVWTGNVDDSAMEAQFWLEDDTGSTVSKTRTSSFSNVDDSLDVSGLSGTISKVRAYLKDTDSFNGGYSGDLSIYEIRQGG